MQVSFAGSVMDKPCSSRRVNRMAAGLEEGFDSDCEGGESWNQVYMSLKDGEETTLTVGNAAASLLVSVKNRIVRVYMMSDLSTIQS